MSETAALGLSETYGAFIDNVYQPVRGETFAAEHAGTGETLARIARCAGEEVDAAVAAAARAFPAWRATMPEERAALDGIAASLASGEFVLPIAATFPLDRIADAVALQRTGHVRGKVVLTVA